MSKTNFIPRILLYLSVGLFGYYLYSFDYIVFDNLHPNWKILVLSVLLLWSGFFMSALSWRKSLLIYNFRISWQMAVYSHGISIFGKYIPGKIWVILGRASVVAKKLGKVSVLSTISLKEQLIYLFSGLVVSTFALIWIPINWIYAVITGLTALVLGLFLFAPSVHRLMEKVVYKLFKKTLGMPSISFREMRPLFLSVMWYWLLWSVGFYTLTLAFFPETTPLAAFAFPLSVCYGLLAVVMPGGIGVRETIIVLILKSLGLSSEEAITISVIQRLWFMTGEIFIFGMAVYLKTKSLKGEN